MNWNRILLQWIESLVISILFIATSVWLDDPLSLNSVFPWIWFAPVLIALRYGLWPAVMSMALILMHYVKNNPLAIYTIPIQLFVLDGFLLTLLCIVFHSHWQKKISFSEKLSNYLQQRIQSTAHAYMVVLFSYERLEQSLVTKPVTVRNSLNDLRNLLAEGKDKLDQEILYRVLNIIAMNCSVEVAGIYPVTNGKVQQKLIASVGKMKELNTEDFLINECLDKTSTTHISTKEILKGHWSEYLVVAPLLDQQESIYAIIVIAEMPFLKLNEDNLEIINVFLSYFADGNLAKQAKKIRDTYPDCTIDFAKEMQRLFVLEKKTKQDSALVAFWFEDNPHREEYIFELQGQKRGIDSIWETQKANRKILMVLMPLGNRQTVQSYKERIEEIFKRDFAVELNGEEIKFKSCLISSYLTPIDLLKDMMGDR